jgi:hypothetical protein
MALSLKSSSAMSLKAARPACACESPALSLPPSFRRHSEVPVARGQASDTLRRRSISPRIDPGSQGRPAAQACARCKKELFILS